MARRMTNLGTPAAPSWSAEWLALVESEETAFRRRICGAMTQAGTPCTLGANHASGRCRYHGGVVSVGPPCENQNARVHGLYARRLQRCGSHCPLWKSCPFAGEDVMNLPGPQRPICAYERDEYAALMRFYFKAEDLTTDRADHTDRDLTTEGTENTDENSGVGNRVSGIGNAVKDDVRGEIVGDEDGHDDDRVGADLGDVDPVLGLRIPREVEECADPFLLHQLVMLTVMQTRAAAVLSAGTLTEAVEVDSPGYRMKTAKPGAALEAFIRIAREWRALRAVIDTKKLMPKPREMGLASRLAPLMRKAKGIIKECIVEMPDEDISKYEPAWAREEVGAIGEVSCEAVSSGVVNSEVVSSEGGIGETEDCNEGAADSVGESTNGAHDAPSGEVTVSVAESAHVSQEESARPEAVRPPPLLWSDVLARRSRSRFDDFLFGDRGG